MSLPPLPPKSFYPNLEDVERATLLELCRWYRFLPSPGARAIGRTEEEFYAALAADKPVQDRIIQRMQEMGGMTPAISKAIGWDPQ